MGFTLSLSSVIAELNKTVKMMLKVVTTIHQEVEEKKPPSVEKTFEWLQWEWREKETQNITENIMPRSVCVDNVLHQVQADSNFEELYLTA